MDRNWKVRSSKVCGDGKVQKKVRIFEMEKKIK